jgi:hypothetical protein
MTKERIEALDAAKFVWDPPSYSWQERFSQVEKLVEQFGSLEAIPRDTPFEGPASSKGENLLVSAWIKVRRKIHEVKRLQ